MNEAIDAARLLLADALRLDAGAIDESASIHSVPQWDSLAHMRIILAMEKKLGHTLQPEVIVEIESLRDVASVLGAQKARDR